MEPCGRQQELEAMSCGIRRCTLCRLHQSRRLAVPGDGPADAAIMLVGEAPGRLEDEQGLPFVGPSGRFLDGVLSAGGLSRRRLYITSSVKCRPPDNRAPRADELAICRENWLTRQIELVAPRVIVLLGQVAAKQVLGESGRVSDFRGRGIDACGATCIVTYHPAGARRRGDGAALMAADLRLAVSLAGE